ncbi:hypothetical protein SUGI_1480130 [Cryptomeria japonica]|nr:hypothetical protein SUGI_1480130 [Cryptomeria japonica]
MSGSDGGDPSSPAAPLARLFIGWYHNVSKAVYWLWGLLLAATGIIRFIVYILSTVEPDIMEETPKEQTPSTTVHPTGTAQIMGPQPEAAKAPLESTIENIGTNAAINNVHAPSEPQAASEELREIVGKTRAIESSEEPTNLRDQLELFKALEKRWQERIWRTKPCRSKGTGPSPPSVDITRDL